MNCNECENLKVYVTQLEGERDELRLQVLEMAQHAHELKLEVKAFLEMVAPGS